MFLNETNQCRFNKIEKHVKLSGNINGNINKTRRELSRKRTRKHKDDSINCYPRQTMAPAVATVVMVGLTFVVKISLVYSTSGSGICSKDG